MRALDPLPDSLLDPSRAPRFGSYTGAFDRVDLDPIASRVDRLFRRKRWMWMSIVKDDLVFCACVVDLGYAANAFAFVARDRMLVDRSVIAARARVRGDGGASIDHRALRISLSPSSMRVQGRGLSIDAALDASEAPPAITAVARAGKVNVTQKRALLSARGAAEIEGERVSLDGGLAGYDFTCGLLARHTAWRWAFGMGRDRAGAPIAFNLVQGFVGRAECALFRPGATVGLEEARFSFDEQEPMKPWRVTSPEADLQFRPTGVHAERKNLGVVRSRFLQITGAWSGTIADAELTDVLGVAEDQDVVW